MRWLPIVFCVLAIEAQTVTTQPGSIGGRVTNSVTGDLIPGVAIHLLPLRYAGDHAPQLQTTSQSDGSFHFDSVPPGTYLVLTERDGFVASQSDAVSHMVPVQAGQAVGDVTVQLTPQGTVAGKVVDEEGKPMPAANVRALSKSQRGSTATTDASGSFKLLKLMPGDYYLWADPPAKSQDGFVRTFYPQALSLDDATTISVTAGQDTPDITIRLLKAATYHIKGKIIEPSDEAQIQRFRISITPRAPINAAEFTKSVRVNPDRTFEVDGLVPGNYTLRLTGQFSRTGRANRLLARQDAEIGSRSLDDVVLPVTPPITLTGHVAAADSQTPVDFTRVHVMAVPGEDLRRATQVFAPVAADGSFNLANLDPRLYQFRVALSLPGMYVKSVLFNQQDVTDKEVDLSQDGSGQLQIDLRSGAGEIDGTVQPPDSPGLVIIVPENLGPEGWSGVRFGYPRQGSSFAIGDLPPGKYAAFAADRLGFSLWQNPDFLRDISNLGTSVQVDENSRQQVQLQKVPVEQIQQIAARLNLPMQ
ncbi:MAG: carboxypeptidase-like regulatory domain-containing protein [Acidobacteriota bacterium]|nr:carboxypeptidase-like regulatory domain-containing protein [Acidobacteriota bacterium]